MTKIVTKDSEVMRGCMWSQSKQQWTQASRGTDRICRTGINFIFFTLPDKDDLILPILINWCQRVPFEMVTGAVLLFKAKTELIVRHSFLGYWLIMYLLVIKKIHQLNVDTLI